MPNQWKQFSGAWTPTQQLQAKASGVWATKPGTPTIGTATVVGTDVEVSFTPGDTGYPTDVTYTVTSSPGSLVGTGAASPVTVTGFSPSTAYTFTVVASNTSGSSAASAASNSVTPVQNREAYSWGKDAFFEGTLGINIAGAGRSSPVQIGALQDWAVMDSTYLHTMAVKRDGTLWAWGWGGDGRLGTGSTISVSSPVQVGALTNWSKVGAGKDFSAGIKTDGTLWAWGKNAVGQIGQNSTATAYYDSPVQVGARTDWTNIVVGGDCVFAAIDTAVYVFGGNGNGKLGKNDTNNRSSPTQISGAVTSWLSFSTSNDEGGAHSLGVSSDGKLYSWGLRTTGRLMDNQTAVNKLSPVQVGALTTWSKVSAGREVSHAIKTDGTLWSAGSGTFTGTNSGVDKSSPVQVTSATDWDFVDNRSETHVLARKTSGAIWGWMRNENGEMGLNNRTVANYSSPVQISTDTWNSITAGYQTSIGTKDV